MIMEVAPVGHGETIRSPAAYWLAAPFPQLFTAAVAADRDKPGGKWLVSVKSGTGSLRAGANGP
jgi:hypothetical protein